MSFKYTPIAAVLVLLAACSSGTQTGEMPTDLNGLRQWKKEKETALRTLEAEIADIDAKIAKLDTTSNGARKRLVTTGAVASKDFRHFVDIQGSVQAGDAAFASGSIGGKLLSRLVDEGETVRKGQRIGMIDTEAIQKQKQEIETSLNLARDVYQRQKSLWDQKIGSEVQYLQAKNNVERLEKSLETIDANLHLADVRAPITGVVNRVFLEPGESAAPGSPIVEILGTSTVKVVADVPESYLGKIRKRDKVTVNLPALGEEIEARVSLLGASIDPTNRTFKLEVELNNSKGNYKPNLLAEIRFEDYRIEEAVVVPIELIQQEVSGENYVMIVDTVGEHFQAKKAYVEIGQSYQGEIVIEKGLNQGQEVILQGARNVSAGDHLDIQQSK